MENESRLVSPLMIEHNLVHISLGKHLWRFFSLPISFSLAIQVCVQGSMGEGALAGMPLQLAGTRKILDFMDWGDYGAMGTFINIGSVGETSQRFLK